MRRQYESRHLWRAIFGGAVLVIFLIIIMIGINRPKPEVTHGGERPVATASSEVTTTTPPPSLPSTLSTDRPSDDIVWKFEEANLLPDPKSRNVALQQFATARFIQDHQIAEPVHPSTGITVHVVTSKSTINAYPVPAKKTCSIVTFAVIETMRGEAVVNTYTAASHATIWVKTNDGWRADQQVDLELR